MTKRKLILGDFDTSLDGWTLSALKITKASQVQTFVSVPGRYAPLDFSTYLTDGEPYYTSATLEATLENSAPLAGTGLDNRGARTDRITAMLTRLDGNRMNIIHPDFPNRYLIGRVQIRTEYNTPAHAAVKVSAVCDPWLYYATETTRTVSAQTTAQQTTLTNSGKMAVTPTVVVTAQSGQSVTITYGSNSTSLSAGTYTLPWLVLKQGSHAITYKGTGTIKFSYREAVLAG